MQIKILDHDDKFKFETGSYDKYCCKLDLAVNILKEYDPETQIGMYHAGLFLILCHEFDTEKWIEIDEWYGKKHVGGLKTLEKLKLIDFKEY